MYVIQIWTSNLVHTDLVDIWDVKVDAESIRGVGFWSREGKQASFGCLVNTFIQSIIDHTYPPINGIMPLFVRFVDNGLTTFEGYLQADSISFTDEGKDFNRDDIRVASIKVYDVMSCIMDKIKDTEVELQPTISNTYININTQIRNLLTAVNTAPTPFLWTVGFDNEWVDLPDFPYMYDDLMMYNLSMLPVVTVPAPFMEVMCISDQMGMFIMPGTPYPYFIAVHWKMYHLSVWAQGYPNGGAAETISFIRGELRGANLHISEVQTDIYTKQYGIGDPYVAGVLAARYGFGYPFDFTYFHEYISDGRRWNVQGNALLFNGEGSLTQFRAGEYVKIKAVELIGLLLNLKYAYIAMVGHRIKLRNKTALTYQQTPIQITDADEFKHMMIRPTEEGYDPGEDWMEDGAAIIDAVNRYYESMTDWCKYEVSFVTQNTAVGLSDYIYVKGYYGYVNYKQIDEDSGMVTIKAQVIT